MCKITKENDSLQRQTENKDENSQKIVCNENVPELRFPEFEEEWKEHEFGTLFTIKNGLNKGKEYFNHGTPILNYIDVNKRIINSKNTIEGTVEVSAEEIKRYCVKNNDLFLTRTSETSDEIGLTSSYNGDSNNTVFSGFILRARPKKQDINSLFYAYYLRTNKMRFNIIKYSSITTRALINSKNLSKMRVKLPDYNEQKKISTFLSAIDKKIGFMEKKHTLYQNIKKYFLDNLFPHEKMDIPNLSFKEYSNIWKQIKLKQIIYKGKAGGTPKSSIKEYYNGNIPFLSINDMTNEGKYITYTEKSITEKGLKNSSAWLVPEKSLLYSMYASVGFVSINNIPLTTSQAIFNIIFKEHVNLEFMYYYLTFYKQYLHRYIETGTQGNLNAKLIKNFKIKIPSKEEQRKIADFLSLIDTYIEINKEKLNHLKQFKKGLLQKMFC